MKTEEIKTGRRITEKTFQTHFECVCGLNVVDHEVVQIKWKDLPKAGIVRRRDRTTGKPFLLQKTKSNECHCYDW
jgi:hypothetical protein